LLNLQRNVTGSVSSFRVGHHTLSGLPEENPDWIFEAYASPRRVSQL